MFEGAHEHVETLPKGSEIMKSGHLIHYFPPGTRASVEIHESLVKPILLM